MHDNGFQLADSQREMTPIQKFVYARAKDHHTEDYETDKNKLKRTHGATKGF